MRKKHYIDLDYEESLVNLTPLIDVIFVVLISFILIAPMLKIDTVSLTETTSNLPSLSKSNPLRITLKKNGDILLNSQKVNLDVLEKSLKEADKKLAPQIFPDKEVAFFQYQKVKDVVQECGFEEMDIILEPK